MNLPGWRFQALKGPAAGRYAVDASGNWRIPFAFDGEDAIDVELEGDHYARWGKSVHPAGLNFGDCFAYVVARDHGCPLLYVGDDFAHTDLAALIFPS
jgi:hypothetical protein